MRLQAHGREWECFCSWLVAKWQRVSLVIKFISETVIWATLHTVQWTLLFTTSSSDSQQQPARTSHMERSITMHKVRLEWSFTCALMLSMFADCLFISFTVFTPWLAFLASICWQQYSWWSSKCILDIGYTAETINSTKSSVVYQEEEESTCQRQFTTPRPSSSTTGQSLSQRRFRNGDQRKWKSDGICMSQTLEQTSSPHSFQESWTLSFLRPSSTLVGLLTSPSPCSLPTCLVC